MTKRIKKSEKGQSMVEFALVLPLLLILLFGILEFGLIFNSYLTITHASREGARIASLGGTDAEVIARVNDVSAVLYPENLSVAVSPSQFSRDRGNSVTVTVTYRHQLIIPIIGSIIGDTVPVSGATTMRVE